MIRKLVNFPALLLLTPIPIPNLILTSPEPLQLMLLHSMARSSSVLIQMHRLLCSHPVAAHLRCARASMSVLLEPPDQVTNVPEANAAVEPFSNVVTSKHIRLLSPSHGINSNSSVHCKRIDEYVWTRATTIATMPLLRVLMYPAHDHPTWSSQWHIGATDQSKCEWPSSC